MTNCDERAEQRQRRRRLMPPRLAERSIMSSAEMLARGFSS
jgi:hypothetical protein